MAVINNLQQLVAAVSAVCPIDGASADGTIWFSASATPAQIAAANSVVATYTDAAPQLIGVQTLLSRFTDAEYTALMQAATNQLVARPGIHRMLFATRTVDLTDAKVQGVVAALVTAGILTQARANSIFAAPPVAPPPPVAALTL